MPNNTALSFSLGGTPSWQAFFLVLLLKTMIQRLPGAVIFLLTPVLQSNLSNSANMLEHFVPVFPEQWNGIFSFFCMWKFVCAIIDSVIWEYTAARRYKQAVVQAGKGIAPVWFFSKTHYLVLCLLLGMALSLDAASRDSLHAKMYTTSFIWLHHLLVFIHFNTQLLNLDIPVYIRKA